MTTPEKLQKELKKQIAASREIRAIIYAHDELNRVSKRSCVTRSKS